MLEIKINRFHVIIGKTRRILQTKKEMAPKYDCRKLWQFQHCFMVGNVGPSKTSFKSDKSYDAIS